MKLWEKLLGKSEETLRAEAEQRSREMADLSARIAKGKEILLDWDRNQKVLGHAQLYLLAQSMGLVIRHYSEFLGKMPPDKIFRMPVLKGAQKIYKVTEITQVGGYSGFEEGLEKGVHGKYLLASEVASLRRYHASVTRSTDNDNAGNVIEFVVAEYPAVFILATTELFIEKSSDKILDPIVVEMIGDDLALDPGIGTCGKAGQGVPVGVGQPTIKLSGLTVGGTG